MGLLTVIYRIAAGFVRPVKAGDGIRLYGSSSGYVGLKPAAAAGGTDFTLPSADGTNGQVWTTNGSGVISWTTPSGGSAAWESAGGVFQAKTSVIASGDKIKYVSRETDASGAIAHEVDTENAFYGGYSGAFTAPNGSVFTVGSNAKQFVHTVGWYSASVSMQSSMLRFNPYGQSLTNRYGHGVGLFDVNGTTFMYIGRSDFQADGGVRPIQGAYFACGAAECHVVGSNGLGVEYGAQIKLDSPSHSTGGDSCASKSAATNGTLKQFTYDGVDTLVHGDKITTTDATATTAWSETLSDNTAHVVEALIVARRTDSAGRWSGRRRVTVYRAGGGATVEGSVETLGTDISNGITPTVTFDASSNDVRLRVTGESGKTISWRVHIQKVHAN